MKTYKLMHKSILLNNKKDVCKLDEALNVLNIIDTIKKKIIFRNGIMKFAVVILTKNRDEYLKEALKSVCNQKLNLHGL